jgi:outer membrane protein insertion porin family
MNRHGIGLYLLTIGLLAGPRPAAAQALQDPTRWIGTPIVAVEIRVEGRPETSPALATLVDIQPGERLAPEIWRRVVQRLDQVPRYEGVSVLLEDRPGGVALIFDLEPRHPISSLRFEGETGVPAADIERQVRTRFNGLPAVTRRIDVEDEVRQILKNEGYRSATARASVEKLHDPDRATMVLTVDAGLLTTVGSVDLRLRAALDPVKTRERLGVTDGAPFRERALASTLASIRDELRAKHFYTAIAQNQTPTFSDGGAKANLVITIDAGPIVELQVIPSNGLPGGLDDLIPVKRLSSVDRDLLEESQKHIIEQWQARGYRHATASYTRSQPAPDRMLITFTVDRGKRYRIAGIDVPAGARMTLADYQAQPPLKKDAWFNPVEVRGALDAIRAQYQHHGYYQVKMAPEYEEVPGPDAQTGGIIIHPKVTEGARGFVAAIVFHLSPNPVVTEADLRRHLTITEHEPFDLAKWVHDRDELNAYYQSRGFRNHFSTINPLFSPAGPDRTDVTLDVVATEGPQVFFGEIVVVGNEHIKTDTILGRLTFQTGSPYSEQAIVDSRRALNASLAYRNVQITLDEPLPGESTIRVVVSVEEANSKTFDLGPGIEGGTHPRVLADGGTVDELYFAPRAFVSAGLRNLNGRNRSIDGYARVSFKPSNTTDPAISGRVFTEYRVTGTYHDLNAFSSNTDMLVSVTSEQASRTSYNFARRIGAVDISRPLRPRVRLFGRYSLEWTRRFDELLEANELPLIDRLFPQVRLSTVSGAIVWDRRDNPLSPTRGSQVSANLDLAMRLLGSEVGFGKSFFEGSYFLPVARRLTLATRGQLGLARGAARVGTDAEGNEITITDLPASERFYSGGSYSVRGFQLDRLGVREILTEDNLSTGGNGLIVVNVELRARIRQLFHRDLSVVGFVDTGNVFRRAGDLDLGRLRSTAGFGFRYDSPFGPLRLDFGFKTDRMVFAKTTERRWEFHLSIGEVF